MAGDETIKIASYLARCGEGSRRQCEQLVRNGSVRVNGKVVTDPSERVHPRQDTVHMGDRTLVPESPVYILLHKPRGFTCTAKDRHAKQLASDLITPPPAERLFHVGRLDRDSEGLLLFTNDGELANRLTHPRYGVRKTYRAVVRGDPRPRDVKQLEQGIRDHGEHLQAEQARLVWKKQGRAGLEFVLREGKKREVRRMCERLRCTVEHLLRVRFGPLDLGEFRPGYWRHLKKAEVQALRDAVRVER